MKKRLISIILVICMLLNIPLSYAAQGIAKEHLVETKYQVNPFMDVKETDWFYDATVYAVENGLLTGISDTNFAPKGNMTRGMYVTVMGRMMKVDPEDYRASGEFTDVPYNSWYTPYVKWAQEKNITSGIGNGKFNPDGLVTREQMAVFLVRLWDSYNIPYPKTTNLGKPTDMDNISSYAREAVLKLWTCGFFAGDSNGKFNPKNDATRAEAAVFFKRVSQAVNVWLEEINKIPVEENKDKPKENSGGTDSGNGSGNEQEVPDEPPIGDKTYYVTFMDGDKQLDKLSAKENTALGKTPSKEKVAKDGHIFLGWFVDRNFYTPFYSEDILKANTTAYAKYEKINNEKVTLSSFAQIDQDSNLSFDIRKVGSSEDDVEDAVKLMVMDGTDPVELNIVGNGDGYSVSALTGFNEGSSYELILGQGYIFADKDESIRTASFTIKKEEVNNISLNEEMTFIKDTDSMDYIIGDNDSVPVLMSTLMNSETKEKVIGTFDYEDASTIKVGDVLCIYESTDPRSRDYVNNDYANDAEAYIEVTGINGKTITFTSLDETDVEKIVFMPDTIPFSVTELPTGETGQVDKNTIDKDARVSMELGENPEVQKGDFVVFYKGNFSDLKEDDEVYYGLVTGVSGDTISYTQTTKDYIEHSMDTFLEKAQKGEELLEGVDIEALERQIEDQVRESGFDIEAAEYLAMMATQTNGFKTLSGLTSFQVADKDGNILSPSQLAKMNIGGNIHLSDKVKIRAEIGKSSKYFGDGVRLALGIEAEFSVDVGDGGELKIILSATFVEELSVKITAAAHAKVKWIFIVPKFKELSFRTSVDLKNYSAVSVDVKMYTVEKDEESVWDKLKSVTTGKYKDKIEQIEELKDKISQAKETYDKIQGYKKDIENLWASIPSNVTNKEEYENMLNTLGELNVTKELMGLLNLSNEQELDAGVRNLMERYSEMLENESDWIEIVNKEIFQQDGYIWIFAIGIGANFKIKGNVNLALGANMEYVVGKRYSFWFDIVSKTSGSSEMDLLDEKFAFQFYVMGQLGLKMGIEAEVRVGIISTKIGSIGLSAEFGPYIEMWGYFIYEYTKLRPANTSTWNYDEKMMGALYLEFGLYLELKFKAQALGLFKYEPTLLDKKWPLLTAGTRNNVYDFAYAIDKNEVLPVRDEDNNSSNGITMILPEGYRQMEYMDLCEGNIENEIYGYNKFNYTLSNRNFKLDETTGEITVDVPKGVQYMKCDLTLTWKLDKLAFSLRDISVTIPLIWTNLSTEELNERFTVNVRAGNDEDGYTTVWSQRVVKNAPFDLPTDEEIKNILGVYNYGAGAYGNLKYNDIKGYTVDNIKDLTVRQDTNYYFVVTPRTYELTVRNVETANGENENRVYTAKFGQKFDISDLEKTGTNDDFNKEYTEFLKVEASGVSDVARDITEPIGKTFAMEILNGLEYDAIYKDNSITATFNFEGVDIKPIKIKMKKGDTPSSIHFADLLNEKNAIVKSISPAFTPIMNSTNYTILCEVQKGPIKKYTLTYDTNGGSIIAAQNYPVGSIITKPADPVKEGYDFNGWYSDETLLQEFIFDKMPEKDITIYAKWIGKEYTLTFDVNEGDELGENTKKVIFGERYGTLPIPTRKGYGFLGWYDDRVAGNKIAEDTIFQSAKDQTLYAHWGDKLSIDESSIIFEASQTYDYDGEEHKVLFTVEGIDTDSFTVKYKRQNLDNSWGDTAINAGAYDIRISREEDENHTSFDTTYISVMTINKISREIDIELTGSGYKANISIGKISEDAYPGDGELQFAVSTGSSAPNGGWQNSRTFMNLDRGDYYLFARVLEGENYFAVNIMSDTTISVEDTKDDMLGYDYQGMIIKTSDIKDAGTDSIIKGRIHYLDGSSTDLTDFAYKGYNDFERGDMAIYVVTGNILVPWMVERLELDYTKKGSKAGWHCDYIIPVIGIAGVTTESRSVSGEKISVNQWFGANENNQSHVVWEGTTDSMKRHIKGVGNFYEMDSSITLNEASNTSYNFTYDGYVTDQYGFDVLTHEDTSYNAYDYLDAPTLVVETGIKEYDACIDYTVNSFSIDKEALYKAMKLRGENSITLEVKLIFPERSTKSGTDIWTKAITITIVE